MLIFIICFGLALLILTALWFCLLVKMDDLDQRMSDMQWNYVIDREFDEEEDE